MNKITIDEKGKFQFNISPLAGSKLKKYVEEIIQSNTLTDLQKISKLAYLDMYFDESVTNFLRTVYNFSDVKITILCNKSSIVRLKDFENEDKGDLNIYGISKLHEFIYQIQSGQLLEMVPAAQFEFARKFWKTKEYSAKSKAHGLYYRGLNSPITEYINGIKDENIDRLSWQPNNNSPFGVCLIINEEHKYLHLNHTVYKPTQKFNFGIALMFGEFPDDNSFNSNRYIKNVQNNITIEKNVFVDESPEEVSI